MNGLVIHAPCKPMEFHTICTNSEEHRTWGGGPEQIAKAFIPQAVAESLAMVAGSTMPVMGREALS